MPERVKLKLDKIRTDGDTQVRCELNLTAVDDYADYYESGKELGDLQVVHDGSSYWLWDGFHRVFAARKAGLSELWCEIQPGTVHNARWLALSANNRHGLQLTQKDRRRAVALALRQRPDASDELVASHTGVTGKTVASVRREMESTSEIPESPVRVGKDGRAVSTPRTPRQGNNQKPTPEETDTVVAAWKDVPVGGTLSQVPKDAWGIPIQPHAVPAFEAIPRFKELIAAIQRAQQLFNEVASLPGGKFLTLPDVSSYRKLGKEGEDAGRFVHDGLERAYRQVKAAQPMHTVCPYQYAETPHPENCRTCCGLGWTPALGNSIPQSAIDRAKEELG